MLVTGNTLNNNDVGTQTQAGHLPYVANTATDGDQSNLADLFFGRGNSPVGCADVSSNTFSGNTVDFRVAGAGGGLVRNVDTGETFCSIQAAIDDADTVDGHTIEVTPGTYNESPVVDKSLTLVSTGGRDVTTIALQTGTNYTHSLLITGAEVTVDGFTVQGIDASCPTLAATNIYLSTAPDNVVIKNNRIQVGLPGGCTTFDDGFGLITTYSGNPDVASLTVEDNIFEPLNAAGQRAYYINPSVVDFTFRGNEINSQFNGTAASEAQNNLIEDNTITGTGTSGGFVLAGYVDATVWGAGTVQRNTITGTANGITIVDAENVTVTKNILDANDRGVRVLSVVGPFDQSTIHINYNAITNNTTMGIDNQLDQTEFGNIDGMCNWWNAADGPGPVGPGSGDNVSSDVDFTPWLYTDDLDGPCFIGGTITVTKLAGDVGDQFEFDPSWSLDNFLLYSGESKTSDPLPPGNYSVEEVNLPPGWSLESAVCVNEGGPLSPIPPVTPDSIDVEDYDEWVCTFTNVYTPPPDNTCPVEGSSNQWTDILGIGMGNGKKHKNLAKVMIPNSADVLTLYGQLVAKADGHANYVRFLYPNSTFEQVNAITSPSPRLASTFWYGADLDPANHIRGRWFLQANGTKKHIPRALVLYPTYEDEDNEYVNVFQTFDAADADFYWNPIGGWPQSRTITVDIAPPEAPVTFNVQLAIADNDKDARPIHVTVTAGGVTQTVMPNNPNKGDQLNIIEFTLANVPAGTDEIVIELFSPSPNTFGTGPMGGDSAAMVGMTANYLCEPIGY